MKAKRNLIQICLSCALMLSAVVQAQDYIYTTNNDGTLTITGYIGSGGAVSIPGTINDLPVSSIADWAFYSTDVTNVTIPDTVTNIGDGAFFDCESLTNVTIGNSVTDIGDWTFAFCSSLTSVNFRGNAPSLGGADVFYGNLATVYYLLGTTNWGPSFDGHPAVLWNPPVPFNYTINNDTVTITGYTGSGGAVAIPGNINFLPVTSIGNQAFAGNYSLTSVTIPNNVTNIGDAVFDNCAFLTAITVDAANSFYGSIDGVLFDKSQTLLIQFPGGLSGSYAIPYSVTSIAEGAFADCLSLANITIPSSVTNIGDAAFYDSRGLINVTIPDSVISIGESAFEGTSLTNVTIPGSVTRLGDNAFLYCFGLMSATIPGSVNNIGDNMFRECFNLTNVTISSGITNIGDRAFYDCSGLTSITIPGSITNIGQFAFGYCTSLKSFYFTGNGPDIDSSAFIGCWFAAIYHLPGTTGWISTSYFGGVVGSALWLPALQTSEGCFSMQTNQFGFNINWASGQTVVVEACTNLVNPVWQPVQTNTLTSGSSYFSDPQWTNYPGRFYRLRSP
jgi:hypothetical protein